MSFTSIHLPLGLYGQVHSGGNSWEESYYEKPHKTPQEEQALGQEDQLEGPLRQPQQLSRSFPW
jgi:hypothetical protein